MACNRRAVTQRTHDEKVQSTSMSRKIFLALLAGASTLAVVHPAAAIEASEPTVVYADQMRQRPAPLRTASADRPGMGGGFIEFLFTVGQSGRRAQSQQPSYESRRLLLPPMDPQQSMRRQEDAVEPAHPSF